MPGPMQGYPFGGGGGPAMPMRPGGPNVPGIGVAPNMRAGGGPQAMGQAPGMPMPMRPGGPNVPGMGVAPNMRGGAGQQGQNAVNQVQNFANQGAGMAAGMGFNPAFVGALGVPGQAAMPGAVGGWGLPGAYQPRPKQKPNQISPQQAQAVNAGMLTGTLGIGGLGTVGHLGV